MARGGTSMKKHGCGAQTEHLTGLGYSWLSIIIGIACVCSCVYVLQMIFVNERSCGPFQRFMSPLSKIQPVLNSSQQTQASLASAESTFQPVQSPNMSILESRKATDLSRIVFGIGAAATTWSKRKEYIKQWWRPDLRAILWLDNKVNDTWEESLPPYKISGDTSEFKYTFRGGKRSGIRISRIVSETFRLGLPDVDWFVMGDDDTFFFPDNLVKVLSKYDYNQMYYVGSVSETHIQNVLFSYNMAFGGGGFAISYPLAKALEKTQDSCLKRYPQLFGSDDRMHACMSELGVPLTKELGFHQMDINGDAFGLLAAHPLTPLVSIHHLDVIKPIFPNYTREAALEHLGKAAKVESASVLQQSICYSKRQKWSFSISWGFVVQVYKGFETPRVLEMPIRTFQSCRRKTNKTEFPFNTRENPSDLCKQPSLYYMESTEGPSAATKSLLESVYLKEDNWKKRRYCEKQLEPLTSVKRIRVLKEPVKESWFQAPRRSCCSIKEWQTDAIEIHIGACHQGEAII